MDKIDFDKFICDFLSFKIDKNLQKKYSMELYRRNYVGITIDYIRKSINNAILNQGFEYKSGQLTPIENNDPSTINFKEDTEPDNMIKPIFKIGDLVRHKINDDTVTIEQIDEVRQYYSYKGFNGAAVIHSDFKFSEQDEWQLITRKHEAPQKVCIYISGPISGYDLEERRKAFMEIEERLKAQGYETVNPMKNGLPDEATTHEHMKRDIELLLTCDRIYFMKKWTHSKGCKLEFDVATAIGLPVMFEEAIELTKFCKMITFE